MRVFMLGLLLMTAAFAFGEEAAWDIDLRQRAIRRADPVQNAARRTASEARGRQAAPLHVNVVDGSYDPVILAPIELIDQVISVYNLPPDRQEKFRREWTERGAEEVLGGDFWERVRGVVMSRTQCQRPDVLANGRAIWSTGFDRFLYEVVAPGVYFTTSSSDPKRMMDPEFWLDEWRLMEEDCG